MVEESRAVTCARTREMAIATMAVPVLSTRRVTWGMTAPTAARETPCMETVVEGRAATFAPTRETANVTTEVPVLSTQHAMQGMTAPTVAREMAVVDSMCLPMGRWPPRLRCARGDGSVQRERWSVCAAAEGSVRIAERRPSIVGGHSVQQCRQPRLLAHASHATLTPCRRNGVERW